MVEKIDSSYLRYLNREFKLKDLRQSLQYSQKLMALWGSEYVEFRHNQEEELIYPTNGSFHLLGIGRTVDVKRYTYQDFLDMLSETKADTFAICLFSIIPIPPDGDFARLFDITMLKPYTDYPSTITELEESGWVSTSPSQSFICTDPRRFTIRKNAELISEKLEDYIGESYEVDSLGSDFWKELTEGIEELWSSRLKVVSNEQQAVEGEENGHT